MGCWYLIWVCFHSCHVFSWCCVLRGECKRACACVRISWCTGAALDKDTSSHGPEFLSPPLLLPVKGKANFHSLAWRARLWVDSAPGQVRWPSTGKGNGEREALASFGLAHHRARSSDPERLCNHCRWTSQEFSHLCDSIASSGICGHGQTCLVTGFGRQNGLTTRVCSSSWT